MPDRFDVAIIGAGIMGCATAYELSKRGLRVVVLEQASIGSGSTGRSSAIIRQHYSNELTCRMARDSLAVFRDFGERVGGECGFVGTGFLALAADRDAANLERNVALQQRVGIRTALVTPTDLGELLPGIATADIAAAAYEPDSGYADPHLTVNAYADAARRLGAEIRTRTKVTGIEFDGHEVCGVRTSTGVIDTDAAINCAGPWASAVGQLARLTLPITSCRVQVATFRRPPSHEAPHPVVIDFACGSYFRSETGTLSLVGLVDPAEADEIVPPDDYDEGARDDFVALVGERFVTRIPAMEASEARGGYAGLYAVTPDWHPVIDELPAGSGCYVCAGFSGHGFKLAPAVSVMIADLVTRASEPTYDPAPFRLGRYARDELVTGKYAFSIVG